MNLCSKCFAGKCSKRFCVFVRLLKPHCWHLLQDLCMGFILQCVYKIRFSSLLCFVYLLIKNLLCKCTDQTLFLKFMEFWNTLELQRSTVTIAPTQMMWRSKCITLSCNLEFCRIYFVITSEIPSSHVLSIPYRKPFAPFLFNLQPFHVKSSVAPQ